MRARKSSVDRQVEQLRRAGLRATGPRVAILNALVHDRSHPTAEQVYESLKADYPSLSLSTVYQTLEAFLDARLIRWVPGARGRLRVDGTEDSHDHAICRECGEIYDIDRRHFPLPAPPPRLPQGLRVKGLRLEYEVLCSSCASR